MNTKALFSSATDSWETPQDLFDYYNKIFKFDIDLCAEESNAKCKIYYSKEVDSLKQDWKGTCWLNPPYGREIHLWMKKAYDASVENDACIVALIPARTDTKWWHDYVKKAYKVEEIKGRLKFGNAKNSAPFPSAVVIFMNGYVR